MQKELARSERRAAKPGKIYHPTEQNFRNVCAERDRLKAINAELLKALNLVRKWLCYDGPVKNDGITHPAFVKANNAVLAAIARAKKG